MNIIRISLASIALTLGFGLVGCEKAPEAETPAAETPAAPAETPK